jgi:subtilase family serine protease
MDEHGAFRVSISLEDAFSMKTIGKRGVHSLFAIAAFGAMTALAPAAILRPSLVAGVPHGAGMHDLGRANASVSVRLALVLAYRNEAQLDRLLDAQGDDSSPLYGRYLTAEQFRASFSPAAETYARVIGLLRKAGFTVTNTFPNRTVIDAVAPAPVVERYFNTEIHRLAIDGMGVKYANSRPALLPEELRGAVYSVLGFDDINWYKPLFRLGSPSAIPAVVIGPPLRGPSGGFGPLAFAQGYDLPVQHKIPHSKKGTTYDGSGRTAAIEIPADPSDTDLAKFLTQFAITRTGTTNRVPVDGGPQNPSGGAEIEAALDYETIAGVAPGANINIYEFPGFTNQDVLDGYNAAVSDNTADTINSSFGACEIAGIFNPKSIAKIFKQGSAQGQQFHASSGDNGTFTYGCSSSVNVLTPADTPYTMAIGGTKLVVDANGNWVSESYWNQGGDVGGGGGVSTIFGEPKWQKKAGLTYTGRAEPDVSYDAAPASGEAIVFRNNWETVGGTSLASPIFGGCLVELDQVAGARVHKPFMNVYKNWHTLGYGSGSTVYAHDITTGTPFGILIPGPGYDLATGIGTLDCFVGGQAYL